MLDERLDLLTGLMSGQPFSYHGAHYQVNEVAFSPAVSATCGIRPPNKAFENTQSGLLLLVDSEEEE